MMRARLQQADIARLREFGLRTLSRRGTLSAEEEQAARTSLSEMQAVAPGAELLADGARLNRASILLDGWATRQRVLSDGRRQIFSFLLPGDIFGICADPDGKAYCNTIALTAVIVAPLPMLDNIRHDGPGVPDRIVREMLSLDESLLVSQVVRLGRQSAYERLINLLLEFHDRLAAVGMVDGDRFNLPFTQEVLSDALGLSTVHTNRTLQQLRREHLIETQMNQMHLLNPKMLPEIADYRRPACLEPARV